MKNGPYPYYEIADIHTLRDLIDYGKSAGGQRTVFYTGKKNDVPVSFLEASQKIESFGTFLLHRGLSGAHIAILGENSTEWCLSYFAVVNSGNVAVPLDRDLPEEELSPTQARCLLLTTGCSSWTSWLNSTAVPWRSSASPLRTGR